MDKIKLPDGRIIAIKDIAKRVTNRTNHNLRTKKTSRTKNRFTPIKYTIEDRIFMSTQCLDAIVAKYGVTPNVAQNLKYHSRYVLEKLEINPRDHTSTTPK